MISGIILGHLGADLCILRCKKLQGVTPKKRRRKKFVVIWAFFC
jgi:hypothetical protein